MHKDFKLSGRGVKAAQDPASIRLPPASKRDRLLFGAGLYSDKYGNLIRTSVSFCRLHYEIAGNSTGLCPYTIRANVKPLRVNVKPAQSHPVTWRKKANGVS